MIDVSKLAWTVVFVGCDKRGPPSCRKWCRDEEACKGCKSFNTSADRRTTHRHEEKRMDGE